jgi:hypothetical protein
MFLIVAALALPIEFNLIGRLTLSEVLLAAALPFVIRRASSGAVGPLARQFYIFAGLWLLGAVATDVIRQTPFEDYSRGWAKIAFTVINFTSILLIVDRKIERVVMFIFVLMVSEAIKLRLDFDGSGLGAEIFGSAWKFGYGQLLAAASFLLSAVLISSPYTRLFGIGLPFVDAALNILLNARNLFGVTALSALVLALTAGRRRALSPAFIAAVGIAGVAAAWSLVSAYSYAASAGFLGVEAKEKYDTQASGNLGVLLGGREESLASTQAIFDSPIIGHGSWARDIHYVELMMTRLEQAGYEVKENPEFLEDDTIPSHSHLFGAWVEAGVLGAAFWTWALWVALRGVFAATARPTPMSGFIVFIGFSLLWDILFSPFGLDRLVVTPAWLVLMMLVAEKSGRPAGGGRI